MTELTADFVRLRPVIAITCVFAALAATLLAVVVWIYLPFGTDATWYSYPGYAWAMGGDPAENLPGFSLPDPLPDRPIAQFHWENRSMLIVLFTRLWFEVVPATWSGLKAFGVLQFLVLMLLVGTAATRITQRRSLGLLAALLTATDSRVIEHSFSDARPDMFIAVTAMGLLLSLHAGLQSMRRLPFIVATVLAIILPMLHLTGAMAVAYIVGFLFCYAWLNRADQSSAEHLKIAVFFTVLMIAVFFLKQSLLDVLIPTRAPLSLEIAGRYSLLHEIQAIIAAGALAKVLVEIRRWHDYFILASTAHLLFIGLGTTLAIWLTSRSLRRVPTDAVFKTGTMTALFVGFFTAIGTMVVFDSHSMRGHLLPTLVFGYLGSVVALGMALRDRLLNPKLLLVATLSIVGLSSVLNIAHASAIYREGESLGISNSRIKAALLDVLPKRGTVSVIGPSEIWPYLAERHEPLLLLDQREVYRHNGWNFDIDAIPRSHEADYLVINKGMVDVDGWTQATELWTQKGLIEKLVQVGDCAKGTDCYVIFRRINESSSKVGAAN